MTDTANAPERIVEIINYVLQDQEHNRLVPRVADIAYTAFMSAKRPNEEDGGPSDWFTDTRPTVIAMIEAIAKEVAPLSQAISTHCDELVAAAYLDAAQRIEQCLWSQHWYIDGESVDPEDLSEDITSRTPDDARAALSEINKLRGE